MRPGTDEAILRARIRKAERLLEHGDDVQVIVLLPGRDPSHAQQAREAMHRALDSLGQVSTVVTKPYRHGRRMIFVCSHQSSPLEKSNRYDTSDNA